MLEVAENTKELKTVSLEKDTWMLALPAALCRREGLAEGTVACLTFKNGAVQTSLIAPSEEVEDWVRQVVDEEAGYFAVIAASEVRNDVRSCGIERHD